MCGIGGVTMYQGSTIPTTTRIAFVKALVDSLLIDNTRRGSNASGVAVFNTDTWGIYKDAIAGEKMVNTKEYLDFTNDFINEKTLNILIHTRAWTTGHPSNNLNNHPIETDRVVGVHNGMIWNDDAVFHSYGLKRRAEVDSEAIFALADVVGFENESITPRGAQRVANELEGMATYNMVDKEERNVMWHTKKDNESSFCYVPEFNITFHASEYRFVTHTLDYALEAMIYYGLLTKDEAGKIRNASLLDEPSYGTIWKFNALAEDGAAQFTSKRRYDIDCDEGWNSYYYGRAYSYKPSACSVSAAKEAAGVSDDEFMKACGVAAKVTKGEEVTEEEKALAVKHGLLSGIEQ